jgi:hypothetical protein
MRQVKLVALLSRDGRSLLAFVVVRGVQEWESLQREQYNKTNKFVLGEIHGAEST